MWRYKYCTFFYKFSQTTGTHTNIDTFNGIEGLDIMVINIFLIIFHDC